MTRLRAAGIICAVPLAYAAFLGCLAFFGIRGLARFCIRQRRGLAIVGAVLIAARLGGII